VDERETIAIFIHLPLEMTMMHTLTRSPLLLLTLALVLVSCQANDAPRDAPSQKPPVASSLKPNILFILADDLGKEWISCYGAEDIKTPHIDALAAGGMIFHNAYSMPQCTPSRATLLTGTYPWRNGFVNHWDVPRWGSWILRLEEKGEHHLCPLIERPGL
jgi:hypothetical protein